MPWKNDSVGTGTYLKAMTIEDILDFNQSNFQVSIVKADIYPQVNPDKIVNLYIALIQCIKSDLEMHLKQSPFLALTTIDRLEDYESYISLRTLFLIMNDFLTKIGFTDIVFEDVVAPKVMRTRIIISQFINFLIFWDSRIDKTKELEDMLVALETKRDQMATLAPSVQRKFTDAKAAIARAELANEQLVASCKEWRQKLCTLSEERNSKRTRTEETKSAYAKLTADKEKLLSEIEELREEMKRLESLIACPPDELQKTMEIKRSDLKIIKAEINMRRTQIVQLSAKKATIGNWKSRVKKTADVMTAIHEQLELVRALETEYANLTHKGKGLRIEISDHQLKLEDMRKQLSSYDENWDALELQHRAKVKAKKAMLHEIKKNNKVLQRNVNEKDVVFGSLFDEIKQLRDKQEHLQKEYDKLDTDLPDAYVDLMTSIDNFHLKLAQHMEAALKIIQAIPVIEFNLEDHLNK